MKPISARLSTLVVGVVAVVYACGDHTATGPARVSASSQASLIRPFPDGRADRRGQLDSCSSSVDSTVTKLIGHRGGIIALGADWLWVPPGALRHNVTIQAIQKAGRDAHVIEFEPSGLRFRKPVMLTMSYASCSVVQGGPRRRIALVDDDFEIIEYVKSKDIENAQLVVGEIRHFSNYAIAW